MSSYCSLDDARSAGATGSDQEITDAIAEASERVENYTGDLFAPVTLTMQLVVDPEGAVSVRKRIRSITSVTWLGAAQPVVASAYRVSSSSTLGARDVIYLYGDLSWADITVLGAEPWAGGFPALGRTREPRVTVVGSFGWDAPPSAVRRATARIASLIRSEDVLTDDDSSGGMTTDTEGNVLPVVPPFMDADTTQQAVADAVAAQGRIRSRTTGDLKADAELAQYVREPVRIRA